MRRTQSEDPPLVYRSAGMIVLGGISLLVAAWFILDGLGELGRPGSRIGIGVTLVLGVLIFAVTVRPALIADDRGVLIRNPLRSIRVPWSRVKEFSVRYALDVDTDERSFSSWAVGRSSWRREHNVAARSWQSLSFADQAVEELTTRLEQRRARPGKANAADDQTKVVWSVPMLAASGVAIGWLVLALVFQ